MSEPIFFTSATEFGDWLAAHHDSESEVWVGYWKKHTGKPSLVWSDAVDEALCHGWIDGLLRRIDGERHMQRFTPRKPSSNWSAINIGKVAALREAGRMRPAGEAAYARRRADRSGVYSFEQATEPELTPEQRARFEAESEAWAFFQGQPQSYRRPAIWWVIGAKRPETRARRLATLISDSAAGVRVKHLRPLRPKD